MRDSLISFVAAFALATWTPIYNGVLILIVTAGMIVWIYRTMQRMGREVVDLDTIPLPPGTARWIVDQDYNVISSRVSYTDTGIGTGYAGGKPIWEWVDRLSPEGEHYRHAMEDADDAPVTFEARAHEPGQRTSINRVTLLRRADGTLYCESKDVTELTLRAERAEARAEEHAERVRQLMLYSSHDAKRLYRPPVEVDTLVQ